MIYLEILDEKLMRKHNLIPFLPIFPFHPTENIRKPEVQNGSKGNYVIVENKRISFNYARNTFIFAKKTPPEMFGKVINTSLRNNII